MADSDDQWVAARLAALSAGEDWQPDASARLSNAHARRSAGASRRLRWTGAAVMAATVFLAVPGARTFGARCVDTCVAATARATQFWRREEVWSTAPHVIGPRIGNLAPDLLGTDIHGTPIRLSSLRGHVVVVNFWATWCGPCRQEIPLFNDLQARLGSQGLDVIGVSVDEEGWPAVESFIAGQPVDYTVTLGTGDVASAYGDVTALPMTFVIDREGRIVVKRVGLMTEGDYDTQIGKLLTH